MKNTKNVDLDYSRSYRLTVRLTLRDQQRLEALRSKLSPYAKLSLGKTISAVLKMADENLNKKIS
jgi:hypothetical protein